MSEIPKNSPAPAPAPAMASPSPTPAPAAPDSERDDALDTPVTPFKDQVPCNWIIEATENGITARSDVTGETFSGSVKDFNRALRG